jgi:hypothetical protein
MRSTTARAISAASAPTSASAGTQAAEPEIVVCEGGVADDLDRAECAPAVGHLRHAGRGSDRQQRDEPGRRVRRHKRGLARETGLALDRHEADAPIEAGVELRGHQQLHQLRLALLLRQRERQRGRVVAVLQAQLGLQRVALGLDDDADAADEGQQQGADQQQPDLADQRHDDPPPDKRDKQCPAAALERLPVGVRLIGSPRCAP